MLGTDNSNDVDINLYEMTLNECYEWIKNRFNAEWGDKNKWNNGYSEQQINEFEKHWSITFPPMYKQFLMTLGAPINHSPHYRWIEEKNDMGYVDLPTFYDWQKDTIFIQQAFDNVRDGLIFDIEHNRLWLDSWGEKPDCLEQAISQFDKVYAKAPKLIPLVGHRYLLEDEYFGTHIVLSVHQSDIITYGFNFRRFLISQISSQLDINYTKAYDYALEEDFDLLKQIPFWGEIIS